MKKLILIAILALGVQSCGSIQSYTSELLPKQESVESTESKDDLFVLANEWMVESFGNAESVIQFTDKEAGIVKGKYVLQEGSYTPGVYVGYGIRTASTTVKSVTAIITVRVKEGSVRLEIQPTSNSSYSVGTGMYSHIRTGYDSTSYERDVTALITSFKNRINSGSSEF